MLYRSREEESDMRASQYSNVTRHRRPGLVSIPAVGGFCEEKHRLIREFLDAIHQLNLIQEEQTQAVIDGDSDFSRFDVLLHLALEKKDNAKYAWMTHVETHGCEEA